MLLSETFILAMCSGLALFSYCAGQWAEYAAVL